MVKCVVFPHLYSLPFAYEISFFYIYMISKETIDHVYQSFIVGNEIWEIWFI